MRRGWPLCLVLLALPLASVSGQNVPWPRSAGMAGADFALTRGVYAIEWNPANLFVDDSVGFSFLTSLHGGRVRIDGASVSDLADIVTAAGTGDPSLLESIPAEGLRIDALSEGSTANKLAEILDLPDPSGTSLPTFGVSYKGGGLVIRSQTVAVLRVSKELVDLAVNGFNPERINEYASRNTGLRTFTFSSATVGLAKHLGRLSAGVGLRYVFGRKLLNGRVFEPEIDVDAELLSATAASVESRDGNGFGLDVGLTYAITPDLFVSGAVQNLWQHMTWSESLFSSQSTLDQDDLGSTDLREIIGRFRATEFKSNATTLEAYAAAQSLFTESFLPRVARVGIGWRAPTRTEIQLTASRTWGPGILAPVGLDRVAAGVDQMLGVLHLRTGAAWERGSSQQVGVGLGFELSSFKIDLSGGWTRGTGGAGQPMHGLSASIGFGFVFVERKSL
jgi:hypothetical protein